MAEDGARQPAGLPPGVRGNDPEFADLVDDLIRSSESFRSWWADHDVLALTSTVKQIPHRRIGPLRLRQLQSRPENRPELRLRILVPDDDATRQALTPST